MLGQTQHCKTRPQFATLPVNLLFVVRVKYNREISNSQTKNLSFTIVTQMTGHLYVSYAVTQSSRTFYSNPLTGYKTVILSHNVHKAAIFSHNVHKTVSAYRVSQQVATPRGHSSHDGTVGRPAVREGASRRAAGAGVRAIRHGSTRSVSSVRGR